MQKHRPLTGPITLAVGLVVCFSPAGVLGDLIGITSSSDVPSPQYVITFDGLGTGPISDPSMFDDGSPTGIVFGDTTGLALIPGSDGSDARIIDISPFPGTASIEILVNSPVSEVGVDFVHSEGTPDLEFEAYDAGSTLLGTTTSVGGSGFFGLKRTGGEEIASVIIHNSTFGFTIDNLTSASVAVGFADADGDGIPDDQDACPNSDMSPTIVIDGVDTGVENDLFDDGCASSDLISQVLGEDPSVSAVVHLLVDLKGDGTITGQELGAIIQSLNSP